VCHGDPLRVRAGQRVLLSGRGLSRDLTVLFAGRAHAPLRRARIGWVAVVPGNAASGAVRVRDRGGRRSNAVGPLRVTPPTPAVVTQASGGAPAAPAAPTPAGPFAGTAMWIWELPRSNGGDVAAIIAQAHAAGVSTLFIKSADGGDHAWSQFTPRLVATFKAAGLHVCAWQYVYGSKPAGEAALGAQAAAQGAECLLIDAESEYSGRYASAQTYMQGLRTALGPSYPIALASFPYVDYHPGVPYSVFLGPNGAQFNAPQMYWKSIGSSVDTVFAHTYAHNRIYGRTIVPLGQSSEDPSPVDMQRFRSLAGAYGAPGLSWWVWQFTTARGWQGISSPLAPLIGFVPDTSMALLAKGAKGDEVVWMQEHLAAASPGLPVDGIFGGQTAAALRAFQGAHGLIASGATDAPTWAALLALVPVAVDWTASAGGGGARVARVGGVRRALRPRSALLPARRNEIPTVGSGHAGATLKG